jgi:DNA polymerase-1
MLVPRSEFKQVMSRLALAPALAIDTETTGLYPYLGDKLFAIIIHDGVQSYYFNFNPATRSEVEVGYVLPTTLLPEFNALLSSPERELYFHNAKFDIAMLSEAGITVGDKIFCTQVNARLIHNDLLKYSLDALAKLWLGKEKDPAVNAYIKANDLYKVSHGEKTKCFDRVPLSIMVPYAEKDTELTWKLAQYEIEQLHEMAARGRSTGSPAHDTLVENERKLITVCRSMERTGIRVNKQYVEEALDYDRDRVRKSAQEFERLAGIPLVDSYQSIGPALAGSGVVFGETEKGAPSISAPSLAAYAENNPLVGLLFEYRSTAKRISTYWENFLRLTDSQGYLHASFRQDGTLTGRLSSADPNLQNLTKRKDKGSTYPVRGAFVPFPNETLVSLDFSQMEYRLMLDYAGEMGLIEAIKAGEDVHTSTAKMVGIDRDSAKTLNFLLLYGGGVAKFCADTYKVPMHLKHLKALCCVQIRGMSPMVPKDYREVYANYTPEVIALCLEKLKLCAATYDQYFQRLPKVKAFINLVKDRATGRRYVWNWYGRVLRAQRGHEYAIPNHVIQGGCADINKIGLVRVFDKLTAEKRKTKMLATVHDELLLSVPKDEKHIVEDIKNILESVYPYRHLPMQCGLSYSQESWAKMSGDMYD